MTLMTQESAGGGAPHEPTPTEPTPRLRPVPDLSELPVAHDVVAVIAVTSVTDLIKVLDRLAAATILPGRLAVVAPEAMDDLGAVIGAHRLRTRLEAVRVLRIPGDVTPARAATAVLGCTDGITDGATFLWLLHQDCRPAVTALDTLLRATRQGRSVAVIAPKVRTGSAPKVRTGSAPKARPGSASTLLSVGYLLTRAGRWVPAPEAGERDQGQYDDRSDVLATATLGSLLDIEAVRRVGGWAPGLLSAELAVAADVDLGWRLHRAGERVLVVPAAIVEIDQGEGHAALAPAVGAVTPASRRALRGIALGAMPILLWPVRILATLLTALAAAGVMLLAKRPRAAGRELVDGAAVLRLDRAFAANRRFARERTVPPRALRRLFITRDEARFDVLDGLIPHSGPRNEPTRQDLALRGGRPQAVVHPAVLAVLAVLVLVVVSGRTLGGSVLSRITWGVTGGEVTGSVTSAADLWRSAADAWGGAGLGAPPGWSPALGLLAGVTAVVEHVPFVEPPAAPAAAAVAGILFLALPLAALTMYAALAFVTPRRSLRAFGGVAWAATGLASHIVGEGRLGGVVVLVGAPLAAAGLIRALSPRGRSYDAAQAGLVLAVLGAFAPVVTGFAIVMVVLLGLTPRWSLRRALGAVAVPLLVLAPFVRELWRDPGSGLGGVGLFDWGGAPADPWRLALLDPSAAAMVADPDAGGLVEFFAPLLPLAAVPLLGLAVLGVLRARSRLASLVAVVVAALALASALVVNRVVVDVVPLGSPSAGQPIRPWAGSLLAVYALVVVALAVRGLDVLSRVGLRRWTVRFLTPVAGLFAVLALGVATGWVGFGSALSTFVDVRPAVAVDHATGDLAGRALVIERLTADEGAGQATAYRVIGAEGSLPVRTVPTHVEESPSLTALVSQIDSGSWDSPGADVPGGAAEVLARHAIGYVLVTAELPADAARAIDATDGLRRLPDRPGLLWWRVEGTTSDVPSPARVVLRTADGDGVSIPSRHHAQTRADLPAAGVLEVAETRAWSRVSRVSLDGETLTPQVVDDVVQFVVPRAGHVSIDVVTPQRSLQLIAAIALGISAYLALPFGAPRRPRQEEES